MTAKAWHKRQTRKRLRRELKNNLEGWNKIGNWISRMHWGDGLDKGRMRDIF